MKYQIESMKNFDAVNQTTKRWVRRRRAGTGGSRLSGPAGAGAR